MASLSRRMQRRLKRLSQRKLRNNVAGTKLGVTNPRAAKPLSLTPRGSRRRVAPNKGFRVDLPAVTAAKITPYAAPTRAERSDEHKARMIARRRQQLTRIAA